jgi:hypothetical protein
MTYRHLRTLHINMATIKKHLHSISPKLLHMHLCLLFYVDLNSGTALEFLQPLCLNVIYIILKSIGAVEAIKCAEGDWRSGTQYGAGRA